MMMKITAIKRVMILVITNNNIYDLVLLDIIMLKIK